MKKGVSLAILNVLRGYLELGAGGGGVCFWLSECLRISSGISRVPHVLQCIGQFLTMRNFIGKHCRVMTFIERN